MAVDRKSVTVSLPTRVAEGLRAEAERRAISVSALVRERIEAGRGQRELWRDGS